MLTAERLLKCLSDTVGKPLELDDALLEYAVGVLQGVADGDDGDEAIENIDELLTEGCPGDLALCSQAERLEKLACLVLEVRQEAAAAATAQKQQEAAAKAASAPSASASQASGSCGLEQGMQRLAVASSSSSSGCSVSGCSVPGSRPPAASAAGGLTGAGCAAVQELQALSGGALAPEFLQHVLLRCFGGDLEAAAAWLLDTGAEELRAAEEEWQEHQQQAVQQEEEARLLKERNKALILNKFDLRPVPQNPPPKKGGKGQGPTLEAWTSKESQKKVRYLDGRVVSQKGEKFIIEKIGEEWDGGSRGKVYTKGKRGKGFA